MTELEFTGERFHPECIREMWYEHWHRYVFALPLARGKQVLDLACGEGYGSHLLSTVAEQVTGVDFDAQAIAHAQQRYQRDNLQYLQGDASQLPFDDDTFERVVSFETIEHLQAQEAMLKEIRRVLKPDGCLLISSPDKKHYSDETGYQNPYHVKELYREQFEQMLHKHFPQVRLWGQRLQFGSMIWPLDRAIDRGDLQILDAEKTVRPLACLKPMYELALCGQEELPAMDDMHWFTDEEASVYQHYDDEVRRNIAAGKVLKEYEAQLASLRKQVEALQARLTPEQARAQVRPWWKFWA